MGKQTDKRRVELSYERQSHKVHKGNQAPSVSIKIRSIDLLPLPHLPQLANLTAANGIKCTH